MTSLRDVLPIGSSRTEQLRGDTLRRLRAREGTRSRNAQSRPKLVLASASPRRMQLLGQLGLEPDGLRPTSIDESPKKGETPRALVTRLSRAKAEVARDQIAQDRDLADSYVLAADTVVAIGRRMLLKPDTVEQAIASIQLLSGRNHHVLTSVCLITPDDKVRQKLVDTRVRFKRLSKDELESYVASREWRGKAGGYAIQGIAGAFVQKLVGSYTNVVGLPLTETVNMLIGDGFPAHHNWLMAADTDPE